MNIRYQGQGMTLWISVDLRRDDIGIPITTTLPWNYYYYYYYYHYSNYSTYCRIIA